jgi:hypothetical protein
MRRLGRLALSAAPFFLAAPGAAGLLLRLTARDSFPVVSTLFYATPPVLTAVAAAAAAVLWGGQRRRARAAAAGALALLLAGYYLGQSWFDAPPAPGGGFRVMLWNIAWGAAGRAPLEERLRAENPDLAVLVEAGKDSSPLAPLFAGYDHRPLSGSFFVAVRGRILESSWERLGNGGRAGVVRFALADREWTMILVDLWAYPLQHRRAAFELLDALRHRLRPDLILGDFNTPRDSVFFDAWRPDWAHAFESAGRGCDATWPYPLPFLAIDHVWARHDLRVLGCRHEGSRASDHRAVVVDLGGTK